MNTQKPGSSSRKYFASVRSIGAIVGVLFFAIVLSSGLLTKRVTHANPAPAPDFGGSDINLITGTETSPHVTQSSSSVWAHGNTVVVAYNDSRGITSSPSSLCGVSVSTDGAATFTRLTTFTGHSPFSNCLGDPTVGYSVKAGRWYMAGFDNSCVGTGIRQWTSSTPADPSGWTPGACISGSVVDSVKTGIDNN